MEDLVRLLVTGSILLLIVVIIFKILFKFRKYQGPEEEVYVYIIENIYLHDTKIGISNNPEKRIKQLQTGSSRQLVIRHTIKFNTRNEATRVENALHKKYSKYRLTGEWFEIDYKKVLKYIEEKLKLE